jgi:hypothetical protein
VSVGILFALREPPVADSSEPGQLLARVTAANANVAQARVEDSKYAE